MSEPREVGPIEGREVHRDPDPTGAAAANDSTAGQDGPPPAASGRALGLRSTWHEIRRNRGRDVPNSRPLPDWVRRFAWVLDDAFAVPGLPGRRVGVDGVIAIVPVAGDIVGVALAMVVVVVGIGAGASVPTILRMMLNVGFEALIGAVPVAGTVFNMAFKANNRNVALIERDLADRRTTRRSSLAVLVLTFGSAVLALVVLVVASVLGIALLILLVLRWL